MDSSLTGRVAIVTGVSRRAGIGFAIARRLLAAGASVLAHSWMAHDLEQPWGAEPGGIGAVMDALGSQRLAHIEADFVDPRSPNKVVAKAVDRLPGWSATRRQPSQAR
jgi:3-oxoacyl-[acyl-carrier protein] reductase